MRAFCLFPFRDLLLELGGELIHGVHGGLVGGAVTDGDVALGDLLFAQDDHVGHLVHLAG